MDLMELRNNRAFPSVHALMMEPFKSIWENDDTPEKGYAIKVFSYAELMCSPKKSNTFIGYSETMRPKKVLKEVFGDENHEIDENMIMAVARYKQELLIASPTYELLETGLETKDKLVTHLRGINFGERTLNGAVVHDPKKVIDQLARIPGLTKDLLGNRDKVQFELEEDAKTRNAREIGYFED